MAAPTTQEMLDSVNSAIYALTKGMAVQRFIIGGKDITSYSLRDLLAVRAQLQIDLAAETSGGVYLLATNPAYTP